MKSSKNSGFLPQLFLSLGALGIVFGDIGTSQLYAFHEAVHAVPFSNDTILGTLSLVFWALIIVVSIKYALIILRADNHGEGGALALLALLKERNKKYLPLFLFITLCGTGLLLGDGMVTPAISVLSAMEGLQVISPALKTFVVPVTLLILGGLFFSQRFGTHKIARIFGPIMLCWFLMNAVIGILAIIKMPSVLYALNPYYAIKLFCQNISAFLKIISGVFLALTGGEALYADLGHFGRLPIQRSWFLVVFPGVALCYFGQGAMLLHAHVLTDSTFYQTVPSWLLTPSVILATIATIIASQSIISALFSLTKQAMLLELFPKIKIIQTSAEHRGQVYVPLVNFVVALGTFMLVLFFENSSRLANMYGIAVNIVMVSATLLILVVAYQNWRWSWWAIALVFIPLLGIDLTFLVANSTKIMDGGWIPLSIALALGIIMKTWNQGIEHVRNIIFKKRSNLSDALKNIKSADLHVSSDLAIVFITDHADEGAESILHYIRLSHTLPKYIINLNVMVEDIPYVSDKQQCEWQQTAPMFYRLKLHYGFMQMINVPEAINQAHKMGKIPAMININALTYFIESQNIVVGNKKCKGFWKWQKKLFAFLQYNDMPSAEFYKLPLSHTLVMGVYINV